MSQDIIHTNPNYSNVLCYFNSTVSLNENGYLFMFGYNGYSKENKIIKLPKQIPNLKQIKMVDCGYLHIICIDYDGELFSFGSNKYGQLGLGKKAKILPFSPVPQQVVGLSYIDYISCGLNFSVVITNDRTAYSFGENIFGQLGIGNSKQYLSPQLIPGLTDIEFITCGGNHSICKTFLNEYYSWGDNKCGEIGQGNNDDSKIPTKCINWPEDIVDIKCGYGYSILLTSKGYLYSFGRNYCGQLGLNDENIKSINIPTLIKDIPLIKRIECGCNHSMCIDINDNLWIFGNNYYGQLGLGDSEHRYKPTLNESLHDIIDISSEGNHTFIKTLHTGIYAFGWNSDAQLGIETSEKYQLTPIQVFKDNEDIWGSNIRRSKQKSARK